MRAGACAARTVEDIWCADAREVRVRGRLLAAELVGERFEPWRRQGHLRDAAFLVEHHQLLLPFGVENDAVVHVLDLLVRVCPVA